MITLVAISPFKEHPIVNSGDEINDFDIVLPEKNLNTSKKFNLQLYCRGLLSKIIELPKSKIKPFLQYQCEQLADPFTWINKLEKLIDLNRDCFTTKEQNIKIEKTLVVIELLRQEIESNKFSGSKYNFKKVKQKIQVYKTPEEKLCYLLEVKTEYLQYKPVLVDPTEVPFDVQCDLEMNLLKTQQELNLKRNGTYTAELKAPLGPLKKLALSEVEGIPKPLPKLQINSKLNSFVDIFYQLMYEKQINGKPVLTGTPNEVAEVISKVFIDKEGNEISQETVKTILKPSRFEKRPKGNARLDVF